MSSKPTLLSAAKLALTIKQLREATPGWNLFNADPVAIVGIGCRFPGNAASPEEYWQLLRNGVDAVGQIPPDRWDKEEFFDPNPQSPGMMNSRSGSFLTGVDQFDPILFGISPREAKSIDPQQRLLLEVAWEAIWDSGRAPESLGGSRTGVFTAILGTDYERLSFDEPTAIGPNTCAGVYHSVASGRISFLLDLRGPSVSLDTACSSSLVAVHTACQSLRNYECDQALAGGVNLHLLPEHYIGLSKLGMLSPDGKCKAFDASANGFVPGEGCGVVVLKRLADALASRDRIYAVIRGSAINQDGRTNVMKAPSGMAKRAVVRQALANGRVDPSSVSYVETHGTGTALGDPIEVEALAEALDSGPEPKIPCALGAVKTNLGHLEAAAGIAGLIKVALAFVREQIPPNLHFHKLNPHISLEGTRFHLPTSLTLWPRTNQIRTAGVSSFGFSGTNAHIVMEESPLPPPPRTAPDNANRQCELLSLSARTPKALQDFARAYRQFLAQEEAPPSLQDVCRTSAACWSHYEERLALTADSREELISLLEDYTAGRSRTGIANGRALRDQPEPVFVFSGQGSQWPGMGVSLLGEPVFRSVLKKCDELIRLEAGWSVLEQLAADARSSLLGRTQYAQPAIFAAEVALARLWQSWGIRPGAVIGHSAGEIAAAHIAGVLTLEDAVRLIVARGRLMDAATGQGRMAVVYLSASAVERDLLPHASGVSIAAINSPTSTVIAGDSKAVTELLVRLDASGIGNRLMPVDYAFHSPQMDPYRDELVRMFSGLVGRKQETPLISTVFGRRINSEAFSASYWGDNIRRPVQFASAVKDALTAGLKTFIEVGPHPVLLSSIGECLEGSGDGYTLVPSLRRDHDGRRVMLTSLGTLYAAGLPVDWNAVYPRTASPISLPAYPYQRQRFWADQPKKTASRNTLHPLVGRRLKSPSIQGVVFETEIAIQSLPYLADHRIDNELLLPMTAFLEMAYYAARESRSADVALSDIAVMEPLILPESGARTCQIVIQENTFSIYSLHDDDWTLHASGRLEQMTQEQPRPLAAEDQAFTSSRLPYEDFAERGLAFGPAFRTVMELRTAPGQAISQVRLEDAEKQGAARYWLHPALLDGCVQTAFAAAAETSRESFIPFAIGRLEVFKTAGSTVRAHARIKASGPGFVTADLEILDSEGLRAACISDVRFRRSRPPKTGANMYEVEWRQTPRGPAIASKPGVWVIAADSIADAGQLADALAARGQKAVALAVGEPVEPTWNVRGVVRLPSRDSKDVAIPALTLVQQLLRNFPSNPPQLWLASWDAMPANAGDACEGLWQAPQWGLGRTLAMENPELRCVRVDLHTSGEEFSNLADDLTNWDGEEEIALRKSGRFVPKLQRKLPKERRPERLAIPVRGSFDNLAMEPVERRQPAPGELEIEVETSALNFRDTLNALGMYPGEAGLLGLEFCGRVSRVGEGVEQHEPGDRVMGLAWGSFASFVTTPAALVVKVPENMHPVAAVSTPNVFLTAYHCLIHLGEISSRHKVLIHAAAGGVGLAAVQLAQRAGAEVFATAGSEEKRNYLRSLGVHHVFSSRNLDFVLEIERVTGGSGVDLVLNSLAGDFIAAGFAVLANGGHFIEIGKTGIWPEEQVASLGKKIRYSVVDLGPMLDSERELIQSHLATVTEGLRSGSLRPLPTTVFPIENASAAFRYLAQAKHIGKVVLQHQTPLRVASNRTYLITGGLGAIGLSAAQWLVERGARHMALLGRGSPSASALETIEMMRGAGARVEICQGDVSVREQLAHVMGAALAGMPPIGGVIHAAGVLDDGIALQQTPERFARVMAPKVQGAWNLHELLEGSPLDFFILCSSVASLTGSPGQSGYAAGNAFLDALAHYRRSQGLAALSVNWGAWADAGMAAGVEGRGKRRVLSSLRPMTAERCLASLEEAAANVSAQIAIADVDWSQWTENCGIVSDLIRRKTVDAPSSSGPEIRAQLESVPPGNRKRVLVDYLRERALSVLGLASSHFIDERQPLIEIGLDSLMAVEFRNHLASAFSKQFSVTLLFDYPSIGALADFIIGPVSSPEPEERDLVLEAIENLSDTEAEELLRAELDGR